MHQRDIESPIPSCERPRLVDQDLNNMTISCFRKLIMRQAYFMSLVMILEFGTVTVKVCYVKVESLKKV